MSKKQKLELTWVGKDQRPNLEPRILIEDPALSYHAGHRSEREQFDNRLIFGDNLLALKALEQEMSGKIKCALIDPPYNTGSAFEHYDDAIEHSLWLSMLRDRLALLRKLLRDDGIILCTLDANELFYAGVLFDEVFGRRNRVELFVWKKSYGGGAKSRHVVNQTEFVLCYAKSIEELEPLVLPPSEKVLKYYKFKDEFFSQRGPYRLQPLATTSNEERPNLRYPIEFEGEPVWPEKQWQWSSERVAKARARNELVFTRKGSKVTVSYKQYLRDEEGEERQQKPTSLIDGPYTQQGTKESVDLFGQADKFSFPKPEGLIHHLLEFSTQSGDLVLDSFAGSGTTGAVAHKMGRRWIMIEMGEHAHTHIIPRMRKVIDGQDPGGITETVNWEGGGGFRYYRLAPSLITTDAWGNPVVNKEYNAAMLAEALCKLEGFTYAPSDTVYWQQGHSTERDFLYVTTANLGPDQLRQLSDDVGPDRTLLVLCTAFRAKAADYPNLTVRKIPSHVLDRCEWGKDDYSLAIANLPPAPPPPGQQNLFAEDPA